MASTGESVGGVTSLGDEVLVVRNDSSQLVHVYDVNTRQRVKVALKFPVFHVQFAGWLYT